MRERVSRPVRRLAKLHLPTQWSTLIVSDLDALRTCGVPPFDIDWRFLAWHLGSGYLRTAATALKGLFEIPLGYCARVAPDGAVTLKELWSPWSFVGWNGQSSEENARNLRETIDGCVAGMAGGLDHIHLGLSGGLDSSILAASLHHCGARANAYTFTTDDAVGDERRYARIAAEAFGMPLAEIRYRLDAVDLTQSVASHLPRPVGLPYQQPLYAFWEAQADIGAASMAGNGGDEVFCLMQSATPSVDLWLSTGNMRRALDALGDVCRLTGAPFSIAGRMALTTWLTRHRPYAWRGNPRFLSTDVLHHSSPSQEQELHPWLSPPRGVLPGKKAHVANLLRVQHFVEGPRRSAGARVQYPLLAQPVVELCLQIPTWQWSSGGRSRAVARNAFAGRLPKVLSTRQSKGGPEAFAAHVYLAWRERLIPFLTEGLLARNGIIDQAEVRAALMIDGPPRGFDYLRLLELADAEAWVRRMSDET